MKDSNNMIIDIPCNKCGETEDTAQLFVECEQYAAKKQSCFQQTLI